MEDIILYVHEANLYAGIIYMTYSENLYFRVSSTIGGTIQLQE